jgi:hypothetical protein
VSQLYVVLTRVRNRKSVSSLFMAHSINEIVKEDDRFKKKHIVIRAR